MAEIYGHQWSSQHGDEPSDTWVKGLADLSSADIGTGIMRCLDKPGWPPSLPEFRILCGCDGRTAIEKASHKPFDPGRALPDRGEGRYLLPHEDTRTPEQHMEYLRSLFGGEDAKA